MVSALSGLVSRRRRGYNNSQQVPLLRRRAALAAAAAQPEQIGLSRTDGRVVDHSTPPKNFWPPFLSRPSFGAAREQSKEKEAFFLLPASGIPSPTNEQKGISPLGDTMSLIRAH